MNPLTPRPLVLVDPRPRFLSIQLPPPPLEPLPPARPVDCFFLRRRIFTLFARSSPVFLLVLDLRSPRDASAACSRYPALPRRSPFPFPPVDRELFHPPLSPDVRLKERARVSRGPDEPDAGGGREKWRKRSVVLRADAQSDRRRRRRRCCDNCATPKPLAEVGHPETNRNTSSTPVRSILATDERTPADRDRLESTANSVGRFNPFRPSAPQAGR